MDDITKIKNVCDALKQRTNLQWIAEDVSSYYYGEYWYYAIDAITGLKFIIHENVIKVHGAEEKELWRIPGLGSNQFIYCDINQKFANSTRQLHEYKKVPELALIKIDHFITDARVMHGDVPGTERRRLQRLEDYRLYKKVVSYHPALTLLEPKLVQNGTCCFQIQLTGIRQDWINKALEYYPEVSCCIYAIDIKTPEVANHFKLYLNVFTLANIGSILGKFLDSRLGKLVMAKMTEELGK